MVGPRVLAEELVAGVERRAAAQANNLVPDSPGYYAIFIDSADSLSEPFSAVLRQRKTQLIYIGIATTSLQERLVEQDLRHGAPSTFFRSLGAVLGFRPPPGSLVGKANQNNYKFSSDDTRKIITWINTHLSVSWVEASPAVPEVEDGLIWHHRPLLNIEGNPDALSELERLRAECRRIATAAEANGAT